MLGFNEKLSGDCIRGSSMLNRKLLDSGMSLRQFVYKCQLQGMKTATVYGYFRGIGTPSLQNMEKIAVAFGMFVPCGGERIPDIDTVREWWMPRKGNNEDGYSEDRKSMAG